MDLSLSEEHEALRRLAAEFADREVAPFATAWDRAERVDPKIVPKLGDLGFLGLTIPEQYGGSGGDHFGYVLALEELGRGDSAVRGIVSVSLGLVGKSIDKWGTESQKRRWLPQLCAGRALACFALTEPDNGSDAANLRTKAVREGDSWVISGSKMFITNGTTSDVALAFARTGEAGSGYKGISAFLVPTDLPGFERKEIHGKLGLRGQAPAELVFDGVRVSGDAMLGPEGKGFSVAVSALATGRVSVAAGCVGIAEAALRAAVQHATTRIQFDGKVIAERQLVQELIAAI